MHEAPELGAILRLYRNAVPVIPNRHHRVLDHIPVGGVAQVGVQPLHHPAVVDSLVLTHAGQGGGGFVQHIAARADAAADLLLEPREVADLAAQLCQPRHVLRALQQKAAQPPRGRNGVRQIQQLRRLNKPLSGCRLDGVPDVMEASQRQ